MNTRIATLWDRTQYTADKTEPIDIDIADPISRIVLTIEPDNNPTGANATAHPVRALSKVEIIDGSDVILSLTGQEAQGVDFHDNDKVRPSIMCYLNGMYSEMVVALNFGRYLFDPQYALDPKRFRNLQLKATLDIDGGGDTADDVYLTAIAHCFDEKSVDPVGFLMSKEIKDFALAASSHEYTDLPLDHPYRQLYLRAQVYGSGPEAIINTVKLSEDVDKKIPLNHTMYQILRHMQAQWNPYDEWILVATNTTTGEYYYCTPCYWPNFASTQWRAAGLARGAAQYGGDGGRFTHSMDTVNCNVSVFCKGWAPHALVPLLPRPSMDVEDYYDVRGLRNLKLDVLTTSSASSSDSAQIVAQQVRNY